MASKKYQYWSKKKKYRRSSFEKRVEKDLEERGIKVQYEPKKYQYAVFKTYTPDYLLPNGIFIEVKGWFLPEDRTKLKAIREQYPDLDVRLVFDKNNKIYKKSNTRYSDWCQKHGFKYAFQTVPQEWLEEPPKEVPKSKNKKTLMKLLRGELKNE